MFLEAIVTNLQVTKTHPDCLQGSAELPKSVMDKIGISQYKSVSCLLYTSDAADEL